MTSNGFGLGIPGLGMILVWGAIILLLVWLARIFSRTSDGKEKSAARSSTNATPAAKSTGKSTSRRKETSPDLSPIVSDQ